MVTLPPSLYGQPGSNQYLDHSPTLSSKDTTKKSKTKQISLNKQRCPLPEIEAGVKTFN